MQSQQQMFQYCTRKRVERRDVFSVACRTRNMHDDLRYKASALAKCGDDMT